MQQQPQPTVSSRRQAAAFQLHSVAESYLHRPPWPPALFPALLQLLGERPQRVLDIGCGAGAIARPLAPLVERVDAVDISAAMIAQGRQLPDGDHQALCWQVAAAEEAELDPPYGMVTAGASLHWMNWEVLLPRLCDALAPGGRLVIIDDRQAPLPWGDELQTLIRTYSTNRAFRQVDVGTELEQRGLFQLENRSRTEAVPFTQSIDEYVASFHGRSSFAPEHMGSERAEQFDTAVRALVSRYTPRFVVLQVFAMLTWGTPRRP